MIGGGCPGLLFQSGRSKSNRVENDYPRQAGLSSKGLRPNAAARPSISRVQVADASGTEAETTAIPPQGRSPETSAGFTGTPDVVYLPIVPSPTLTTNRLSPRMSIPTEEFNPSMSEGFTG